MIVEIATHQVRRTSSTYVCSRWIYMLYFGYKRLHTYVLEAVDSDMSVRMH